jgi:hypothetical protein
MRHLEVLRINLHHLNRGSGSSRHDDHRRHASIDGKRQLFDKFFIRQNPIVPSSQYSIDSLQHERPNESHHFSGRSYGHLVTISHHQIESFRATIGRRRGKSIVTACQSVIATSPSSRGTRRCGCAEARGGASPSGQISVCSLVCRSLLVSAIHSRMTALRISCLVILDLLRQPTPETWTAGRALC